MSEQGALPGSEPSPPSWSPSGGASGKTGVSGKACPQVPKGAGVREAIERAFELPDGYTLQIADRTRELAALIEYLVRQGFSGQAPRLTITVDQEEGQSWVRISGSPEVKSFLEDELLGTGPSGRHGGRS